MPRDKLATINLPPSTKQGDEGDGPFLRVTAGQSYQGPYDVDTASLLFWRGDTRPPGEVFQTGFSSRFVRDSNTREIVWRAGVDDIVPASAVCLARDIRGAAFFPYPPDKSEVIEDTNYLYAMTVPRAACTYRIQQMAELAETDQQSWRDPARFGYDPTWSDYDNTSCVWQFGEYAVHDVPAARIIAGWKCTRMILVKKKDEERVQAGIRFRLHGVTRNVNCLDLQGWQGAQAIAGAYAREYPRRYPQFLSYWGIVEALAVPVTSQEQAALTARQIQPILTASDHDWSVRDDGAGASDGTVKLGAAPRGKPFSEWM